MQKTLRQCYNLFDSIQKGKLEQILLTYGLPKETVTTIMMLYKNTKEKVHSSDGDTDYFDIVAGVLQGDTVTKRITYHGIQNGRKRVSHVKWGNETFLRVRVWFVEHRDALIQILASLNRDKNSSISIVWEVPVV